MKRYAEQALIAGILLLVPMAAISAYAQTEVSGTYTNDVAGVQITFPEGWSGFEVAQTPETTLVSTSPGGLSEPDPQTMTINLLVTDKGGRDVNDASSYTQDVIDCNEPSISSRTVAGVQGTELTVECPSTNQKSRIVVVETGDNIVAVMFMTPTSEFDANLAAFDSAVASLTVQGATGTGGAPTTPTDDEPTTPTGDEPSSSMMSVTIAGEPIQVSVESVSTVTAFALDEESKMLTFTTDGTGTETTVAVGSVLEGPYTVMVDGEATTDFEESTDEQGTKTITTTHGTGTHDVTISGTQVVPEFPLAALGAIAAAVGVVAVLGRARFIRV